MKGFPVLCIAMSMLLITLIVPLGETVDVNSGSVYGDPNREGERLVALTFDDGPKDAYTEALLNLLKEKNVPATFFVIGAQVSEHAELISRMDEEGHQIGIHTYRHVDLSCLSEEEQREEIEKSADAIEAIIGDKELLVRPPFGQMDSVLEEWIDRPMILWSIDTEDWTGKDAEKMIQETAERVRDGDIILMHDVSENGLEGAEGIIDELHRMGYTFLTIDQLFACKEIALENGITYHYAR